MTTSNQSDKTVRIAELNDILRTTGLGGRTFVTTGVNALDQSVVNEIMMAVREFSTFSTDNDPHQEHDFGVVTVRGHKIFWKMDYYDKTMEWGSEDPSDPEQTCRVLTIMLASEY